MNGKGSLGVVAGIVVGALVGILVAPDKGSSTRKKLTKKGEDYADELKEKFNEFLESIMVEVVKEKTVEQESAEPATQS